MFEAPGGKVKPHRKARCRYELPGQPSGLLIHTLFQGAGPPLEAARQRQHIAENFTVAQAALGVADNLARKSMFAERAFGNTRPTREPRLWRRFGKFQH